MKVLITGGCGCCGTALTELLHEKVFFDLTSQALALAGEVFVQGSLNDTERLGEAMEGCDAVVHLAGSSNHLSSWEDVLVNNIAGTQQVLAVARAAGIDRIIFASSNRVMEQYEIENAPRIYQPGHGIRLDKMDPARPSTYYGSSKVCGEVLGRYFAETGGPKFYALRIGAVCPPQRDHPYAYAEAGVTEGKWERGSTAYSLQVGRLKGIWLSRRDFVQLVSLCLTYDGAPFDIFYGVSGNATRWHDIEYASKMLGYRPMDDSSNWTLERVRDDSHFAKAIVQPS